MRMSGFPKVYSRSDALRVICRLWRQSFFVARPPSPLRRAGHWVRCRVRHCRNWSENPA